MELFKSKKTIAEGGNLASHDAKGGVSPGWSGIPGEHQAEETDLQVHNRSFAIDVFDKLLHDINNSFAAVYKKPIWPKPALDNQTFLSGSSRAFLDRNIPDEEFVRIKPKVGDIDTQCPEELDPEVQQWLTSIIGKQIGDAKFIGFKPGNHQYSSMWEITLSELPVKVQIDFEFGKYNQKTQEPDEWYQYSHSADWEDIKLGIKGVFHKYLNRALPYSQTSTKYVARVLKKSTKISPEPVTDSDYSFAVSGPGGGGVSNKYKPYIDPATGQPMEQDGVPVMQLLPTESRDYIQNLDQQFTIMYGRKPSKQDRQLMNSFNGTVSLMSKYLDDAKKQEVVNRFLSICFEAGSQMITKDDPARDRSIKFAAIDYLLEHINVSNAKQLRQKAILMSKEYEQTFSSKKQPVAEAEVKAQLRKGMPHLRDLKPADFLDLLDEIHDGNGQFTLQDIPLNVKVDGFGGRFGKNSDGRPFMGTSRTEPRYEASFVKYHQAKGTTDPDILRRAGLFDDLFNEMMEAIQMVDGKLGPNFLVNKQVTCEVLFSPFATETPEGKLRFVGIEYDQLPKGVELVLVPYRIVDATSGEDLPDTEKYLQTMTKLGSQGRVMFMSNRLSQKEGLNVTAIIPPLENLEELKQIVSDTAGKRDRANLALRKQVEEKLKPIQIALEKAIDEDPNIVGKDMLGQDYEGIVINSRLGPIKVTSQRQKDIITAKNAAKVNARTERPRENSNKTAVVAIGSFVGHKGHEELFNYTINKAKEVSGDPYLFIGNAVGKDDPIPTDVKVETWRKLYPQYANNISTVTQEGGSLLQKIKHELINPLPGKAPRYDNIIIMVGEDQAGLTMPQALMKAVNKFQGYEHVKVSLEVTPRGTGISFTQLRNSLKNDPPEQQLKVWSNAFDVNKLGVDWIKHLMDITRKGMGIKMPQQPKSPLAETRLFNALIGPSYIAELGEQPKKSWADYGMPTPAPLKPIQQPPVYQGWQDYEKAKQPATPLQKEEEGDAEGLPHLTKELLQHIIQQVGTEGAHAIIKSLEWGDGAAKELLHLIVKDLKNNISMAESVKQRLDKSCWKGYHKAGTKMKGGVRVNNCVPNESVAEGWKEETTEHDEFLAHARQQLQNATPVERTRLAQRLSKLEQKHFPEMYSSENNGISSSIAGMLQHITDTRPRPNQQFGTVTTPQGTGTTEPLRPEPISPRPTGATTSFAEPDGDEFDTQDDSFQDMINWYQSASPQEQHQWIQHIADQADMTPEEAKEYLAYVIKNGEIEPEEWKQMQGEVDEEFTQPSVAVDNKGRTHQQWMSAVKARFPQAQIIRAKMVGGPIQARLPDGRTFTWNKVEQGVAEGKEEYNRELNQKGFHFEQEIDGVTYRVSNVKGGSDNIKIHALDAKGKVIGSASFWRHQYQDGLESLSTSVDPAWQGKGIATNMYAVMRMLGVNIHPATMQTDDGKKMWDKWRKQGDAKYIKSMNAKMTEQGVAEGSLNEFAPDGFNGGDDDEGFSPEIAKMAQEDGFTKGAGLADGATLERAITINHWHSTHGGMYKQYFAKGFKAGRMDKIRHNNKQYNLNLKLMKDGSIRHGEQGVAEDWNKVNHHDKTNGLSQKAVNAYRHEHPGSKLKTAVTTKPSKLKVGSKDAKRRKSFCARMGGMKGPMKDEHGKPTAKAKALSRWNCNENIEEARMSAQVKLQRAFQREQEKSTASHKRGEEIMAKAKADAAKQAEKTKDVNRKDKYVPVSEHVENKMASLISLLENK